MIDRQKRIKKVNNTLLWLFHCAVVANGSVTVETKVCNSVDVVFDGPQILFDMFNIL